MEPVVRIVANIKIDSSGRIFDCDRETQALFGYDQSELLRMDIREVLTGLKLPSSKEDSSIDIHRFDNSIWSFKAVP
jgi:PAS domain-containing protein